MPSYADLYVLAVPKQMFRDPHIATMMETEAIADMKRMMYDGFSAIVDV